MNVTIYHNPRCSKSRETLALLESRGISPEIVLYLEHPPAVSMLRKIARLLNRPPEAFVRFKEKTAKELGLKKDDVRTEAEWMTLMVENPVLIERPIVVVNGERAEIGRPPEAVLTLLK